MTGRVYSVRGSLSCNSPNFVYISFCKNCGDQYISSATDFNARFRIHKSDIKNKKDKRVTTRHFNSKCCDRISPHIFLRVQLIESVQGDVNLERKLREREKFWQCQLFINANGMNSVCDLYSGKRKGCRKTDGVRFVNLCTFNTLFT